MRYPFHLLLIGSLCLPSIAWSQKAPDLGYVFPPAVNAGATTSVQLGGYDYTPDVIVHIHNPLIQLSDQGPPGPFLIPKPPYWFGTKSRSSALPIPREIPITFTLPESIQPGWTHWQVSNANGSSQTAVLLVTDDDEILEKRYRDQPQVLDSLPLAVSGRLARIAEIDRYQFSSPHNGPITLQLMARQLGANFNGVLQVHDSDGNLLADVADTMGLDTQLTFYGKAHRSYQVSLHDVDFRGHPSYVYRLIFTDGPRILTTLPAYGQQGKTQRVQFIGYGLKSGRSRLETLERNITFPNTQDTPFFNYQLKTEFGIAPTIAIPLSLHPELTEETIRSSSSTVLSPPLAITGLLESASQSESYWWSSATGQTWHLSALSHAIGTRLDLAISIHDADGKLVAENDDLPGTPDAGVEFTAPRKGRYECRIRDNSGHAGEATAIYRFSLKLQAAEFTMDVPQQVHIPVNGKGALLVKVNKKGGFKQDIRLSVEGLPPGITIAESPVIKAEKNELNIPLLASSETEILSTWIQIHGTALVDQNPPLGIATAPLSGNLCQKDPNRSRTSRILLTTTLDPPFTVELIDRNRQRAVHRGTTYPAPFIVKRDKGFHGEVFLQMSAVQSRHRQGIHGPIVSVPPDTEHVFYPCFLPEWLETDRTTRMSVLGVGKVRGPDGKLHYITKEANARVTMILEGALLKITHLAEELTISGGESFDVPLEISRSSKLSAPIRIQLIVPEELTGLIQCAPLVIPVEQSAAVLHIQTADSPRVKGQWKLKVHATAQRDNQWPVLSETEVPVVFRVPVL